MCDVDGSILLLIIVTNRNVWSVLQNVIFSLMAWALTRNVFHSSVIDNFTSNRELTGSTPIRENSEIFSHYVWLLNLSAGAKLSDNEPTEENASSLQVPASAEPANADEGDAIVFMEPCIDPSSGDWILNEFDIECIAVGAGIMGCGGGGSPYLGRLKALQLIKAGKEMRVTHPNR